jgi:hypothetical protein
MKLGDAREGHVEDALGFARIAAPQSERAQSQVSVSERGVQRESLGVASHGEQIFLRSLVLVRFPDELERRLGRIGAGRAR